MNKQEAYGILSKELNALAARPRSELQELIGKTTTQSHQNSSGISYTLEIQCFPGDDGGSNMEIAGTIVSDGQWHFDPLTERIKV